MHPKTSLVFAAMVLCLAANMYAAGAAWAQNASGNQQTVTLLLEHSQPSVWNNLLLDGLKKATAKYGMRANVVYAPPGSSQEEIFRKAAGDSDLVIVASDSMHEILRDNAANFRRVKFGCIDAGIRAPNIMSVTFADEQAAFLAGACAAMLTTSPNAPGINPQNTIAWLSGCDTPAMRSLFNGYSEGAKLANPQTRVIQAMAGSFTDPAMAAQKAAWLRQNGADIVALAAGAGNDAAAASLEDAWHIDLDATGNGSRSAGAITKAVDRAVMEIVASAASGKFRGKEIVIYDLANGGVDFIGADKLSAATKDANIARRVAELRQELKNGSIKLHSLRARTLCDCLD